MHFSRIQLHLNLIEVLILDLDIFKFSKIVDASLFKKKKIRESLHIILKQISLGVGWLGTELSRWYQMGIEPRTTEQPRVNTGI